MNQKTKNVKVIFSPISERYWSVGCEGKIDGNQIRVTGCWFPFDERWVVEDVETENK